MVPLIPLYRVSLGASPLQLGLLTGAGFLTSRFGNRGLISAGIVTYAAKLLIATASDAITLIGYRSLAPH